MSKVAIVNRTNLKNYGSVLQTYALCEAINTLGYDSEIIWEEGNISKNYDLRPNKIISTVLKLITHPQLLKSTFSSIKGVKKTIISDKTIQMFDNFIQLKVKRVFYPAKLMNKRNVGMMYDKFICGSDQVWCTTTTYVDPLMYLRFAPQEKRIAYAPSLGRNYIPNYNARRIRKYIREIPDVSVREYEGQRLIKELTGRDVPVAADPTLLLPKSKWDEMKTDPNINEKYILCYFLTTPSKETQQQLSKYISKTGEKIIALNSKLEYLEDSFDVGYPDCGPMEFIGYVSKAQLVLTDSYHGMLFSIIYQRQFWSIEREYGEFDQSSRQLSALKTFGQEQRYVKLSKHMNFSSSYIDYTNVENKLNSFVETSLDYLNSALKK